MTYERTLGSDVPLNPTAGEHLSVGDQPAMAVPVGCPVYTADDDKLGKVKEVQSGYFKVDASMQPDYWLSVENVTSVAPDRITLAFVKDRLGDFKSDIPSA